tara:strand:- start:60 stop:908 length:849 start_codon:yes stop_codon:yes gene_type:complete
LINIFNYPFINQNLNIDTVDFFIVSIFLLSIGSFISTLIYRLSRIGKFKISDLIYPRSRCPTCKKQISSLNLIPLIGFLRQQGKCINCKNKISFFYPITEIFFLILGIFIVLNYGYSILSIYLFLILTIFYILFFLDLNFLYLPLPLNIIITVLGLTGNTFFSLAIEDSIYIFNISPLWFSIFGFLIGYIFLYLVNYFFKLYKGIDGIGGGDFILFGGIGSIFGPLSLGPILFLSSVLGILYFVFCVKMNRSELPLGSFLILGSCCYFFIKTFELFEDYLVL